MAQMSHEFLLFRSQQRDALVYVKDFVFLIFVYTVQDHYLKKDINHMLYLFKVLLKVNKNTKILRSVTYTKNTIVSSVVRASVVGFASQL